MCEAINDKIYIAGGLSENLKILTSFEVYDESRNVWEVMGIQLKFPTVGSHMHYLEY